MTTVGGLGHALPYLIPHFWTATTLAAIIVVVELLRLPGSRTATWKHPGFVLPCRYFLAAASYLPPAFSSAMPDRRQIYCGYGWLSQHHGC